MKFFDEPGYAVDVFYVLLMYSTHYDYLPELYEVLGKELMIKILDIFSDVTIQFPSSKELSKLASEVSIYIRIKKSTTKNRTKVISDLADEYLIDVETVNEIYARVKSIVEDQLGMEVLSGKQKPRRYRVNAY